MSAADVLRLRGAGDPVTSWPQPELIKAELPPAPAFDAGALLPRALADFVLDEADRMPCSPDYIAAALMVALGSVVGARCAIKPKRRDDWIVTPNLFGGVVGDPSAKKTPAIGTVMRFLDRLEAGEAEKHADALKVHEAEMAAFEARQSALKATMKKAANGKGGRRQLSWPLGDNYPGRFEAGVGLAFLGFHFFERAAGAPCCWAERRR